MNPIINSRDICLNMIVKNEAHVIEETLNNLSSYIQFSYYVICDTGSTDETINIIKSFFDSKNINGEIYSDEWKNFGYNRTLALQKAYKKSKYLFIFDADDKIEGNLILPVLLNHDCYYFKFGSNILYKRALLINNHLNWEFKGVLHEFIFCTNQNYNLKIIDLEGNYNIISGKTGFRNIDPEKYLKDAHILEEAFYEAEKNNDNIKFRYAFYTAQSYRDYGDDQNAIIWYKKRAEMDDWLQEKYYSYFMIGQLYYKNNDFEKAIYYWTLAHECDSTRLEHIYEIVTHYRKNSKYILANFFLNMVNKTDKFDFSDKLFSNKLIYDFLLDYECIINYCYVNKHQITIPIFQKLFNNRSIPIIFKINILENFIFYTPFIQKNLLFQEQFFDFLKDLHLNIKFFNDKMINCIRKSCDKFIDNYQFFDTDLIKTKLINKSAENIKTFLSITFSSNFDNFKKIMDSFIICAKDICQIDYFFCVVKNDILIEDRKKLIIQYPFFHFFFKNDDQHFFEDSLNIILEKLRNINPDYWINLQDDLIFIKPCSFIYDSMKLFSSDLANQNNIAQIVFNLNYGVTIDSFNRSGHVILNNNFSLHNYKEVSIVDENNLNSCMNWPHFTIMNSIIDFRKISHLDNFDSGNPDFEKKYAIEFYNSNLKTAFFNNIHGINV